MTFDINCQNWAPRGATWYYSEKFAFSGDINYMKFQSIADTIINDKRCSIIYKDRQLLCNARSDKEYMYSENDTVYYYDSVFNEFQILYDFSAELGDSWFIKVKEDGFNTDTVIVTVDSIGSTTINDHNLKSLFVTYVIRSGDYSIDYQSTIVERVGDIIYMFNFSSISAGVCDMNWTDGLRCYEDSIIGHYETGIADSCTYTYVWTGLETPGTNDGRIILFPNPTNDIIQIRYPVNNYDRLTFRVFDLSGKSILFGDTQNSRSFSLKNCSPGLYQVLFFDPEGRMVQQLEVIKK